MRFLGSQQFKMFHGKHKNAGAPALVGVRKQHLERAVHKLDDRTLRFTISTGAIDRDLDTINVKGWDLDNFQRNPVVLWAHRADELPIGKAVDFGRDDHRLYSAVQFLPGGYGSASDLADTVYRMAADGWLAATSVGFRPIKWDFTQDKERGGEHVGGWPGIDFEQQELIELSIVSVPSNPDALIETGERPLIQPGGGEHDSAPVIVPAPVQLLDFERERRKRRARAAAVGVFAASPSVAGTAEDGSPA